MTSPRHAAAGRCALWALFALALAIASLFVAWRALAAVDFAYPVLYDALGLGATIERYGPDNDVRPGFHRTTRAERERIFAAIAEAIRNDGAGLAKLRYRAPDGRVLGLVLTEAEVQHLNDVATLVRRFERVGWAALGALVALTATAGVRRLRPPRARYFGAGAAVVVLGTATVVLALGPTDVFYWLHERVFPPDHQWFFYYQESLMSMMMRAPDLFGAIAVVWLALALAIAAVVFWAIDRGLRRRAGSQRR